jgi:hypothetical protein
MEQGLRKDETEFGDLPALGQKPPMFLVAVFTNSIRL